jgi:DNA-directed RNA polymerase specialized sigma24 family protein
LTAIIRRACTEVRRTEVAAKRIRDAMAEEVRPTFDPVPRLESREELAQVPRGLRRLDLETLDAFLRHGCNYASTAAELRIPIGSLSTRIHEIRAYLRRRRALDK